MTRDELMARMSGEELTAWMALFNVKASEAQEARDAAGSADGVVMYHGRDEGDEDDEEEDGSSDGD